MDAPFAECTLQLFRRQFDHCDVDKVGRVDVSALPTLVRACGAVPLEADLDLIRTTADPTQRGSCDFDDFCRAMHVALRVSLSDADAREAFRALDYNSKGFITPHELRYFLGSMGDTLSPEELNQLFEELATELDLEGNLLYVDAVYHMTAEMYR